VIFNCYGADFLVFSLAPCQQSCREWYHTGRTNALQEGNVLYITAPYLFAEEEQVAQSATSPLVDPRTGTYVGQVLLDFSVTQALGALSSSRTPLSFGGFPLLITTGTNTFLGDTVIGPGLNGSVTAEPVSEVVMPFDLDCQGEGVCIKRKSEFGSIVEAMKGGNTSTVTFERSTADGGMETVHLAFAPIIVPYLDPVDSSDFSRGAIAGSHLIYSLGLAETQGGILEPFAAIEADMQRQINVAIGILAAVIVAAMAASIYISYIVARSISEPMAFLLELIRSLNRRNVDQDPPMVENTTGSKEIINVSNTMESLCRVVRLANLSFYVGDLEAAYRVLLDALRLFKRLGNKKAVGVACNNLGNTMLAMYREMQEERVVSIFGVSRKEIITEGTAYFHEAIQLGEEAYDKFFEVEGWSPDCLDFMQHLSNRYFNRAIFLLTVKNDHDQPDKIESLGFRDLGIATDMDCEIETQGEESGWGCVNRSSKLFNVRLVRIRGYLMLLELGYSDEWKIDENLEELFKMLSDESAIPRSALFNQMSYIGCLQQAETEMMKYLNFKGEIVAAARVAIRMLVEDEHIFYEAELNAIKVLQAYVKSSYSDMDQGTRERLKEALEDMLDNLSDYFETRRRSVASASSRTHSIASKSLRNFGDAHGTGSSSGRWSVPERSSQFVTLEQF
jgi:hypothetical protein